MGMSAPSFGLAVSRDVRCIVAVNTAGVKGVIYAAS